MKQWQDKQQRLNAFKTLHTRSLNAEQQQDNKMDQKLMNSLNAARKGILTYELEHSARRYRRSVRHAVTFK